MTEQAREVRNSGLILCCRYCILSLPLPHPKNDNATYEQGSALRSADAGATWIVETITDWGFRVTVDDSTPVESGSWGDIKSLFR